MLAAAIRGLLLLLCLALVGVLAAVALGGIWLVVRAPQLLILGGVALAACWMLAAMVGAIEGRRRR